MIVFMEFFYLKTSILSETYQIFIALQGVYDNAGNISKWMMVRNDSTKTENYY